MMRLISSFVFLLLFTSASASFVAADDPVWSDSLEQSLKAAAVDGRPVLVKFEADWCGPCQLLSKEFLKPEFKKIHSKCLLTRVDVDQHAELARQYGVENIPTVLLLDSNGQVVAERVGAGDLDKWVEWFEQAVEDTELEIPDVLASAGPPTRTEVKELVGFLANRDAARRQIAMERLMSFPSRSRGPLIDSLEASGSLAQKLSALQILDRWKAPVDGLDPWVEVSFSKERLKRLRAWEEIPIDEAASPAIEFTEDDLQTAKDEIDRLMKTRNVSASLSRLTQFGSHLLPYVYRRLEAAETDDQTSRLTALRYWLTASNELRLGWSAGLMELAATDAGSRRTAANVLIERATINDQDLLLELFADSDPLVRELSLRGLQKVGAKKTDEALANLLKDPDKNVRAAVLKQFASAEANHMAPQVAEFLKTETDGDLIVHALRFMRETGGKLAVEAVLPFKENESWQVRAEVAEALGKIDVDDLPSAVLKERNLAVVGLLDDEDGFVVSRALTALPDKPSQRMVDDLTETAFERPTVAKGIAEWMAERGRYNSDNRGKVVSSLEKFLDHEKAEVRTVGVTALSKVDSKRLLDAQLAKLLDDDDSFVRAATLDAFLVKLESIHDSAAYESVGKGGPHSARGDLVRGVYVPTAPRSSSFFGGLLNVFGSSRSRGVNRPVKPPELIEDPFGGDSTGEAEEALPAIEVLPSTEISPTTDADPESDVDQAVDQDVETGQGDEPELEVPTDSESEEQEAKPTEKLPVLPELAKEEWLKRWAAGEVDTQLADSISKLKSLAVASEANERAAALACQVALGDHDSSLNELRSLAAEEPEFARYVQLILPWLPFEKRTSVFEEMVASEESESALRSLLTGYCKVRNPAGVKTLWSVADLPENDVSFWRRSFLRLNFGDSLSYYNDVKDADISPALLQHVTADIESRYDEMSARQRALALLTLHQLDGAKARELAQTLLDSPAGDKDSMSAEEIESSLAARDLAFRIALMPDKPVRRSYSSAPTEPVDGTVAVKYLESEDEQQVKSVIRFLTFGSESLMKSEEFPDYSLRTYGSTTYYSSSQDQPKVRITKPPIGLSAKMLKGALDHSDLEVKAYAAYLASLLEQDVNLDSLIDFFDANSDQEEIAKLVYRAIASQNAGDLVDVVEGIYDDFDGASDTSLAADIYWTIRVMDGKQALRLRKRIRKEVGMSKLQSY